MKRFGTTTRIAFAMTMWSATVLLAIQLSHLLPDVNEEQLAARTKMCESLAVGCSQFFSKEDPASAALLLDLFSQRNTDVLSIGSRDANQTLTMQLGEHEQIWNSAKSNRNGINAISVPVYRGNELHSHLEVAFKSPIPAGVLGFFSLPIVRLTLVATLLNMLGFTLWLRRCFKQLDPAQAVPTRVRSALDTLAEGVLVLDEQNRIMLANQIIAAMLERNPDDLQGVEIQSLPWDGETRGMELTRLMARLAANENISEIPKLKLRLSDERFQIFKPNASRILDAAGNVRGTLLSLADITLLEAQNERLRYLATRDPMTGCLNRRSFFEQFEQLWKSSLRYKHPLSCIMVDVDHFKSINDTRGHAMGDEVLKAVAATLLHTARDTDLVCRYGGEEFCILLPHVDISGAAQAAERLRKAISELEFPELKVTASIGCSDHMQGAEKPEGMLEQADQSLYFAKRNGRNQVARFDEIGSYV